MAHELRIVSLGCLLDFCLEVGFVGSVVQHCQQNGYFSFQVQMRLADNRATYKKNLEMKPFARACG